MNSVNSATNCRNVIASFVGCSLLFLGPALSRGQDDAVPAEPQSRYWKGNIHTHSLWSDGNDFPEMIAEWYRTHDYNFLALSDHNVLSEGSRWMKHDAIIARKGQTALEKYEKRFGGGWVETRGERGTPGFEIRLKPLDEFRSLVEERGRFIMVQGEEISDSVGGKPVHMNATNLKLVAPPLGGKTVAAAIEANLKAVQDQADRTGREILVHLNHPNFGFAVTAEDMAAAVSERFFEVYNGHPVVKHLGDADHPRVEALWDIANAIRLGQLQTAPLFGVATDDSHSYHGEAGSHVGRGWIMVRSRYLTPEHLIRAIKSGEFYASSGVTLRSVQFDAVSKKLSLEIEAEEGVEYTTEFIGTPVDFDPASEPRLDKDGKPIVATRKYSPAIGQVFTTVAGPRPEFQLTGRELYVRAVVTSSRPPVDPAFKDQRQQAWTQPVGWEHHLKPAAAATSTAVP